MSDFIVVLCGKSLSKKDRLWIADHKERGFLVNIDPHNGVGIFRSSITNLDSNGCLRDDTKLDWRGFQVSVKNGLFNGQTYDEFVARGTTSQCDILKELV